MPQLIDRVRRTTWRACLEAIDDRIHRDAAQIGFFAILSFVPLALLLVATFGLIFDDADVRARVVKTVFENVPLSTDAEAGRLSQLPRHSGARFSRKAHMPSCASSARAFIAITAFVRS
jgi:uncharacterized BrkB/YihY/UPF0761 family membrane protein